MTNGPALRRGVVDDRSWAGSFRRQRDRVAATVDHIGKALRTLDTAPGPGPRGLRRARPPVRRPVKLEVQLVGADRGEHLEAQAAPAFDRVAVREVARVFAAQ